MGPEIREAWERFVVDGEVVSRSVRQLVAQSWKRSASLSVSAMARQAPIADEGELHRQRVSNATIIAAAAPALQRSRMFLADAKSMLILADESGLIIATEGDRRIIDSGRENHLELGGKWREDQIGTNAIGTALVEKRVVQIHGSEHFCSAVQRWTCAAVPISHPANGRILGVVDISGAADAFNPQSMALAVSVGSELEIALDRALRIEHEALLRHFVMKRSVWLSDDMLVLDRYGLIVHATAGDSAHMRAWKESQMNDQVQASPMHEWQSQLRQRSPNASIELVRQKDEAVGAIVILGRSSRKGTFGNAASVQRERSVIFADILGESSAMDTTRERARRLAESGLPILIEGETGTGKELFARAIHAAGRGCETPFVPINCGGMARDLIASELFGYNKGSFTGADERGRSGQILASDGGTLCLDEIGELPLDIQPYLLRVLEDGIVYRIGAQEGKRVDMALVSMTNRSLVAECEAGRFRSDLFYRIAAASVTIPPLRERDDDAVMLAEHFAARAAKRLHRALPKFDPPALDAIRAYAWPGNVRQLRNIIETMVALNSGDCLGVDDLPPEIRSPHPSFKQAAGKSLQQVQEATIRAAIVRCHGNFTEAAKHLGIARSTLYVRLAEYGISHGSS